MTNCVAIRWLPFASDDGYEIVGLDQVENIGVGIEKDNTIACLDLAMRHIVPIWRRCAHWTGLILVGRLHYPDCDGWYAPSTGTISVSMSLYSGSMQYPHRLRSIMHHEIAHAVGCRFPDWESAVFDNLSAIEYGSGYSDSADERVARVYECHACIADEIGGMDRAIKDFAMIYNGEISDRIRNYEFKIRRC